jgi:hypothetical protein
VGGIDEVVALTLYDGVRDLEYSASPALHPLVAYLLQLRRTERAPRRPRTKPEPDTPAKCTSILSFVCSPTPPRRRSAPGVVGSAVWNAVLIGVGSYSDIVLVAVVVTAILYPLITNLLSRKRKDQ